MVGAKLYFSAPIDENGVTHLDKSGKLDLEGTLSRAKMRSKSVRELGEHISMPGNGRRGREGKPAGGQASG
jgi:hypothetical protein